MVARGVPPSHNFSLEYGGASVAMYEGRRPQLLRHGVGVRTLGWLGYVSLFGLDCVARVDTCAECTRYLVYLFVVVRGPGYVLRWIVILDTFAVSHVLDEKSRAKSATGLDRRFQLSWPGRGCVSLRADSLGLSLLFPEGLLGDGGLGSFRLAERAQRLGSCTGSTPCNALTICLTRHGALACFSCVLHVTVTVTTPMNTQTSHLSAL